MESNLEYYIDFVTKEIKKFQEYTNLVKSPDLHPYQIHRALAEYTTIMLSIDADYERVKIEYESIKKEFDAWWDKVFVETKNNLNPISLAGSKWSSVKEIESTARYTYADEYKEWRKKLEVFEHKLSFYRRLKENWKAHLTTLNNLSYSLQNELKTLRLSNEGNERDNSFIEKKEDNSEVHYR